MPYPSHLLRAVGLSVLLGSCGGCHLIYPGRDLDGPTPCIPAETPRELSKTTFPDYIIEPPDVLSIDAIRLIPKEPYKLRTLDAVAIITTGVPEDGTLTGQYAVQPSGAIQLGAHFGAIPAEGLTTEELRQAILRVLKTEYAAPQVSVSIAQLAAQQQIAGERLVAPDGTVNLGTYGRVRVVGLTIEEARAAVESHLSAYLQDPQISVDVLGYNSKVFYIVTQGAGLGDKVIILPSKGNETVLDAIGEIEGLNSHSSTRMWIARPGRNRCNGDQILPIDWLAVTQRGDASTNYQLLPGDRLYVSEDKLVAFDTRVSKVIAPFERIFGVTALATSTAQSVAQFRRTSNNNGNGNNGP
jgi:polysaccharide biosynthesis/export protein